MRNELNDAFKGNKKLLDFYSNKGYSEEQLLAIANVVNVLGTDDPRCVNLAYSARKINYLADGIAQDLDLNTVIDLGYSDDEIEEMIAIKKLKGINVVEYVDKKYDPKQLLILYLIVMNDLPVKKYFNPQELASTMINVLHDAYSLPIEELKVKKVDDLYKMCINIYMESNKAENNERRERRINGFYEKLGTTGLKLNRAANEVLKLAKKFASDDLDKFVMPVTSGRDTAIHMLVADNAHGDLMHYHAVNIIQLNLNNLMMEGKVTEAVNYLKDLYPGLIPEKLIVNRLNSGDISDAKGLLKFIYNLYTYESLLDFEVDRNCIVWFIRCRLAFNGEPFRVFIKKVVEGNEVPKGLVDRMNLV